MDFSDLPLDRQVQNYSGATMAGMTEFLKENTFKQICFQIVVCFVTLNLIDIYFSYFKRSPLSGHLTLIPYQGLLSRNSGTMPTNITFNQNQEKVILCYQHPPRGQHTQVEEEQQQGETS